MQNEAELTLLVGDVNLTLDNIQNNKQNLPAFNAGLMNKVTPDCIRQNKRSKAPRLRAEKRTASEQACKTETH